MKQSISMNQNIFDNGTKYITTNIIIATFPETLAICHDSITLEIRSHRAIVYLPNSIKQRNS